MTYRCCPETGKRCFDGRREAKKACRAMRNRFRLYVCQYCHCWHVTNADKTPNFKVRRTR